MFSPVVTAALMLISAEFLFAAIGGMIKYLSADLSQSQLIFFRNFFALIPLLPWLFKNGVSGLKTQHPGLHLARSFFGLVAMYGFFHVLSNMPLTQAMMVLLIAPFLVPAISKIWLKESMTPISFWAMVIGFIGAAIALKPEQQGYNIFLLIAVMVTTLVAFNKVAIRKMTQTEPATRIVFYFTAFCCLVSAVPALWSWYEISPQHWFWLLAMGVAAGVGQLLMTRAFALSSPNQIGLFTYTSILFAALIGYLGWQEPVTSHIFIGGGLILWAGIVTTRQKWGK